ncbi:MAG: hypothetical protein QOI36_3164 [Pseudonocardiales bacterium]|jgi:protein gp37|nr:hypothetical protein [Pseudonocardiales bacterium]
MCRLAGRTGGCSTTSRTFSALSQRSRSLPVVRGEHWNGYRVDRGSLHYLPLTRWARVRLPLLAETPAVVRFASCEPLLGALDLRPWLDGGLGWMIAGGESGPRARPMHPDWARALRDQCQATDVAFFSSSRGERGGRPRPTTPAVAARPWRQTARSTTARAPARMMRRWSGFGKTAGRLLDGRMWDEFPRRRVRARAVAASR